MGARICMLAAVFLAAAGTSVANSPGIYVPDASFMQGSWCASSAGELIEETWLSAVAEEAIGMSRTVRDGKVANFEFMRIVRRNGELEYLAQPGGKAPTAFALVEWGMDWLAFENPEHDFPQRIEYAKQGGTLLAVISGPEKDGKREEISVRYRRCERPPSEPVKPIPR